MSNDFKKVLVLDDKLRVRDSVDFAVFKGASSRVLSEYSATSASSSQISFNIQVPSELTIISRNVILEAKDLEIQVQGVAQNGKFLVDYGNGHSLAPFPVQQCFSTSSATINNNTVSQNTQDVIEAILRSNDKRWLSRYNGMAPMAFDTYQKYADAVNANNNPNGSWNNMTDNDLLPRGAFPVLIAGNTIGDGVANKTVNITYTGREPVLLSPFTFTDLEDEQAGIYGVQNLNFIFNVSPTGVARILRGVDNSTAGYNVSLQNVNSATFKLYFEYLTAPNSVLLPPRNVVSYYELPRYKSTLNGVATNGQLNVSSPSLQLNQIPDKLIIFCRKMNKGVNDTDSYLPIDNISLNFNNVSGLLSSEKAYSLWRMSVMSGSNQNWLEFSGQAASHQATFNGPCQTVPTSGSMLMLDFAKCIPLSEEYYAPSSLGQFQLQFNLNCTNNTGADIAAGEYELVIITVNSGIYVLERGTSIGYTALLSKSEVLDASQGDYKMSYTEARRLVGGSLKSWIKKALPIGARLAKHFLKKSDHPMAQKGAKVIEALGYGQSGGMAPHLM